MCGIAGFVNPRDNAAALLGQMMNRIVHRGPDDQGTFIDDRVCLGHQRLSIIDLKTGHQPMANADQSCWIVFNGEIYNYLELNRDLAARGHRFVTTSDTETILHLYDEYGERCVDQLNGMFAFVIYDVRRKKLFAARDRFGIKPFYYAASDGEFVFGSEIKALLTHPSVSARVNQRGLTEYIVMQLCLGSKTLFEGIRKLEPAHALSYDLQAGSSRVWEYWRPRYETDHAMTESQAVEELGTLLRDSIRIQLRSDVPLGAYLSGGLDSSTVACLASEMTPQTIKTFTGGFHDKGPFDETVYAKKVASSRKNLEYHEIFSKSHDFSSTISKLIYHMDEPCAGPGLFPQYMVSSLAARHVKVVLGGQGGDEIFGGYARYFLLYLEESLKDIWSHPTHLSAKTLGMLWQKRDLLKAYFPSIKKLWRNGSFSEPWAKRYLRLVNRAEKAPLYFHPDVLDPKQISSMEEEFEAIFNSPANGSVYERAAYFDFKTLLPALLQVEDRVSMAVSLESRVPLLDHRIVEFLARASSSIKFRNGEMKYLFKKVAQSIVPAEIFNRKDKMGFPVPLVQWARGPLRSFLNDILLSQRSRERGLFLNDNIVSALGHEQLFGRDLWGVLCLELWLETFIDNNQREESHNENLNYGRRGIHRV